MESFGLLQQVRVHTPVFGVGPSGPYKSILSQQVIAGVYNIPIFKRSCNPNTAPVSVVFLQSFNSQAGAYGKYSDQPHVVWGPIFAVIRFEIFGREEQSDVPHSV